jgi:cell division initiation protein
VKITPLDIRRREFKRSMRGYSDEEVDIFLDEVADEFERLFQENMEMQDRIHRLEEQIAGHSQIREALEKTLISAQLQSDEMRANARKESELILRDAELKARQIVNESYSETQRVQQALVQLKHLEEDFRFKFRSLLEGHLNLLDEAPIAVRAAVAVGDAGDQKGEPLELGAPEPVSSSENLEANGAGVPEPGEGAASEEVVAQATFGQPAADEQIESDRVAASEGAAAAEQEVADSSPFTSGQAAAGSQDEEEEEEEVPTEETDLAAAELVAELAGFVGESPLAEESIALGEEVDKLEGAESEPAEEPQATGFFFGRRIEPEDNGVFSTPEAKSQEKGRDFEW